MITAAEAERLAVVRKELADEAMDIQIGAAVVGIWLQLERIETQLGVAPAGTTK